MNDSSSWNCFSSKRGYNRESSSDADKMMRGKQTKGGIPDEQFANLLGGKLSFFIMQHFTLLFNHYHAIQIDNEAHLCQSSMNQSIKQFDSNPLSLIEIFKSF